MKQAFKYASLLFVAGALLVTSCSKKKDDDTTVAPVITKDSPVISLPLSYSESDPSSTGWGGNEVSANVSPDAPSAVIKVKGTVDADGPRNLKRLYAAVSKNGGNFVKYDLAGVSNFTHNSDGSILMASSEYKSIEISVPIPIPATGEKVVYSFWFTDGKGSHKNVEKAKQLGLGKVILNGNGLVTFSAVVGDQNNVNPSYLITSGVAGSIAGDSISDLATTEERQAAFKGVDINLVRTNAAGTTRDAAGATDAVPYLLSPNQRSAFNFTVNVYTNANNTIYEEYTGNFDSITLDSEVKGLTFTSSATKIGPVVEGKVYKFKTTFTNERTKVGLIKIVTLTKSLSGSDLAPGYNGPTFKANVTVKSVTINESVTAAAAVAEAKN